MARGRTCGPPSPRDCAKTSVQKNISPHTVYGSVQRYKLYDRMSRSASRLTGQNVRGLTLSSLRF